MDFNHINDVKNYIKKLKDSCGTESKWYKDFEWFSKINYTTTSEYYGELIIFIKKLCEDKDMEIFYIDLNKLLKN